MNKKLSIYTWGINESKDVADKFSQDMLETAKVHNVTTNYIGLGYKFTSQNGSHKQRIDIIKKFLDNVKDPDEILVFMDGGDTLFNDNADTLLKKFLEKNTRILISGEKDFMWQYGGFKDKFNKIESNYRYVNAGVFMGYASSLLKMINEWIIIGKKYTSANDQCLLGIWTYKNMENTELVKIDTNCDIFWTTSGGDYKKLENQKKYIINPYTKTRPVIIHCCGKSNRSINKKFYNAYNTIMNR